MVVGKAGASIGEIGIKARRELEAIFHNRVHLFLDVKAGRWVVALGHASAES